MSYFKEADPVLMKHFLRKMCQVSVKYFEREEAQERLLEQLEVVRESSLSGKDKREIRKELNELRAKIDHALEKERSIQKREFARQSFAEELERRMKHVEKKLEDFIKIKKESSDRMKALDEKIKQRLGLVPPNKVKHNVVQQKKKPLDTKRFSVLLLQLRLLEREHERLASNQKVPKSKLVKLKSRINSLKRKLIEEKDKSIF